MLVLARSTAHAPVASLSFFQTFGAAASSENMPGSTHRIPSAHLHHYCLPLSSAAVIDTFLSVHLLPVCVAGGGA